jgi:hypothetical protein
MNSCLHTVRCTQPVENYLAELRCGFASRRRKHQKKSGWRMLSGLPNSTQSSTALQPRRQKWSGSVRNDDAHHVIYGIQNKHQAAHDPCQLAHEYLTTTVHALILTFSRLLDP